jgi:hypothetical protein
VDAAIGEGLEALKWVNEAANTTPEFELDIFDRCPLAHRRALTLSFPSNSQLLFKADEGEGIDEADSVVDVMNAKVGHLLSVALYLAPPSFWLK